MEGQTGGKRVESELRRGGVLRRGGTSMFSPSPGKDLDLDLD